MGRNLIFRLGVDASDFQKKMAQAGVVADSTGRRIRESMNLSDLGSAASRIMGWGSEATGVGLINSGNIETARDQLAILQKYRDQLAGLGFDDYQFGLVSERIKALEYDIDEYAQSLSRAAESEQEASRDAENLGNEARKTEVPVSKANRALRDLGNSGRRLNIIPGIFRRIRDSASISNGSLEKMIRTIRNFSVVSFSMRIAQGLFGEFGTIARNYISQNAALQAQVNGLSASLSNTLAPAIHLITGALSYVLPYVVGISNAIGQLMGSLLGTGWSAAANGANKMATATGNAAKAQNDMNKQLMSFDQINRLDDSKQSSGSGGGAESISQIEPKTPAWAAKLQQTFTDLFNSAEFQAANAGGRIGMVLNAAIGESVAALGSLDFSAIGSTLSDNFNSMIGAIDWSSAGQLLGAALVALPAVAVGFVQNADWPLVGHTVSQFLANALGTVGDWIRSVDWLQLGRTLKSFISSVDYAGIAQGLGTALGLALGAIGATLWGMIEEPWNDFVEDWLDNTEKAGGDIVAGLLLSLLNGVIGIGSWLWTNFAKPIIDGVKDAFGIHSPSTVFAEIGRYCMEGLGNGFSSGFEWIQQKMSDLKDLVLNAAATLQSAFSFDWKLPQLQLPHLEVFWDPVDNVLAKFFGVTAFPRLNVRWFAQGGILDGAQIFGSMGSTLLGGGEKGREAILPLDTNTGWMDILAERISQVIGEDSGGDVNATINLTIDGNVLTSYVIKGLRSKARSGGVNI